MARLRKGYTRRKDGNLQYGFMYEGKRYFVYGKSYKECEEKADAKREALKKSLYTKNSRITLEKYFEEWEKARVGTVKPSTIYENRGRWKAIKKHLGKRRIAAIERREVIKLQRDLSSEGYNSAVVNNRVSFLKTILESAVTDRIISFNPCKGVKPLKRTEPEARDTIHRALTEEETRLFFQYASGSWYYEFYKFLIMTGCRYGEAAALTWPDIDFKGHVLHVNKTITKDENGRLAVGSTKTKKSDRDIPMNEEVEAVLQAQKEKVNALHGNVFRIDQRIFTPIRGGYVNEASLWRDIKGILEEVEKGTGEQIEHFSLHAFRDTFATRAIESGMNPNTLKTILGHSNLAMTMDLYAHVMPNTKAEEMALVRFAL